jgi:hypothetical protein
VLGRKQPGEADHQTDVSERESADGNWTVAWRAGPSVDEAKRERASADRNWTPAWRGGPIADEAKLERASSRQKLDSNLAWRAGGGQSEARASISRTLRSGDQPTETGQKPGVAGRRPGQANMSADHGRIAIFTRRGPSAGLAGHPLDVPEAERASADRWRKATATEASRSGGPSAGTSGAERSITRP